MHFTATADTDVGIVKHINQDSAIIRQADTPMGEVMMAIICDGMGGLSRGELASAHVIRAFDRWFDYDLPGLSQAGLQTIAGNWVELLKALNRQIMAFLTNPNENMGTTFTGMLFLRDEYMIVHVGDSRAYYLGSMPEILTEDQTYVAREIKRGNMTPEEARTHPRRSVLLQCVGASPNMEPAVYYGRTRLGTYMLCSDGFRHEITPQEIYGSLNAGNLYNKEAMHGNARYLINLNKDRRERDNITVVLVKAE